MHNPGIFYPGIFQDSKSRDFLVPGFFDPGILRDIPGPGYPVDIPTTDHATEGPLFTQISGLEKKMHYAKLMLVRL